MIDSPINEIKSRLDILTVVQDYVQLKKAGTNYKGVCPFHSEKTPSFMVSPAKQIWHCFGCSLGGDIFEFVKQMENVEFAQALRILADRAGVELKKPTVQDFKIAEANDNLYEINKVAADYFARVLWESSTALEALNYLKGRGLTDPTIKKWNLGWAPDDFHYLENFLAKSFNKKDIESAGLIIRKDDGSYFDRFRGRIMFPIVNLHGQTVGFTGRLLHDKPNTGKYINSPETPIYNKSQVLYGLHAAKAKIRKENCAIVVEGNMDVITSHQAGFDQTIASSGTALTLQQLQILRRFTENLIFAFDTDAAGSLATKRALELALSLDFNVKIVEMRQAKDPDELIKKGIGLWQKAVDGASNYVEFFFNKIFDEKKAQAVEDKREIAKELAPLIYRISDPVTKAHFVRKLSNGINVSENVIWDIIHKISLPKPPKAEHMEKKKDRRAVLEDQLLGLSIFVQTKNFLDGLDTSDFSAENTEVFKSIQEADKLSLEELKKKFPQIAERLELLNFFAQTEIYEQNLDAKQELARVAMELNKTILKSKMEKLSQQIFAAQAAKDKSLMDQLSKEFTILSGKISKL